MATSFFNMALQEGHYTREDSASGSTRSTSCFHSSYIYNTTTCSTIHPLFARADFVSHIQSHPTSYTKSLPFLLSSLPLLFSPPSTVRYPPLASRIMPANENPKDTMNAILQTKTARQHRSNHHHRQRRTPHCSKKQAMETHHSKTPNTTAPCARAQTLPIHIRSVTNTAAAIELAAQSSAIEPSTHTAVLAEFHLELGRRAGMTKMKARAIGVRSELRRRKLRGVGPVGVDHGVEKECTTREVC